MDLHGRPRSRCSHLIFFIESAGFRYLFWLAEVDIFDVVNRLLHGSLPARQAHHQDVTARRAHSFVFRAGVGSFPLPVAQRDNLCSARCVNQMRRLRSVSLLIFCTFGQVTGIAWRQRLPVRRAFSRHEFLSTMHKMSSAALPACCFPRNSPFSSILGTPS